MSNKRQKLTLEQGSGLTLTAEGFFNRTKVNVSAFLDYYQGLTPNARKKSDSFWRRLKEGKSLVGVLEARTNTTTGINYAWVEVNLLRGKEPYYVVLFTNEMLKVLIEYQEGRLGIDFTLQDLFDEAERLENLEFNCSKKA